MGCGSCPKKRLTLRSKPKGISKELLEQLQAYVNHRVAVRDRTGTLTRGRCMDLLVEESQGDLVEFGNIAVETPRGLSLIGLNIVESVELLDQPSPANQLKDLRL